MKLRVGHLYPEYLNIYADRGNIAVLEGRASQRGYELAIEHLGLDDAIRPNAYDFFYIGGGQDREQALIAPDLVAKSEAIAAAVGQGVALLAVCGGYQLLGRGYWGRDGSFMPGTGLFPLETIAGSTRLIGDVLLECELEPGERHTLAGFENHAGHTVLDEYALPLGRVLYGFGNDGASRYEGCRVERAIGTYLHGPLLPRNPWLADWLIAQAVAHATGGDPPVFDTLSDDLATEAHRVAAQRARTRGGRR